MLKRSFSFETGQLDFIPIFNICVIHNVKDVIWQFKVGFVNFDGQAVNMRVCYRNAAGRLQGKFAATEKGTNVGKNGRHREWKEGRKGRKGGNSGVDTEL